MSYENSKETKFDARKWAKIDSERLINALFVFGDHRHHFPKIVGNIARQGCLLRSTDGILWRGGIDECVVFGTIECLFPCIFSGTTGRCLMSRKWSPHQLRRREVVRDAPADSTEMNYLAFSNNLTKSITYLWCDSQFLQPGEKWSVWKSCWLVQLKNSARPLFWWFFAIERGPGVAQQIYQYVYLLTVDLKWVN